MDFHIALAALSAILCIASAVPYAKDIFYGTTRPNAITWFLWLFIQAIAIAGQWSSGASFSIVLVIADGFTVAFVFVLSVIGYGYRELHAVDFLCGVLGIIAIIAWLLTGNPVLALMFAVAADLFASFPTIRKAYQDPWSEYPIGWGLTALGGVLGVASTTEFNAANLLFPFFIVFVNGTIFLLAFFGRRSEKKPV